MRSFFKKTWFFIGLFLIVVLGIRHPALGLSLKPWINTLIFLGMLLIGTRLDLSEMFTSVKNFKAIWVCLLCGFAAMPLLSFGLAKIFFGGDRDLYVGIILAGAVPTTQASSVIWTDISQGNRSLSVVLMSVSNFLGVFLSPLILYLLLGASIKLPVLDMMSTLFEFIFLPVVLGQLIKLLFKNLPDGFQSFSRIMNIFIIWTTVLAALSSGGLPSLPLAAVLTSVVLQYLAISLLSFFGSRLAGLNDADAVAVMFCSSQVTLTVAAVIGFSYFAARSIIYVVVYHLFQQVMGQVTAQWLEHSRALKSRASHEYL